MASPVECHADDADQAFAAPSDPVYLPFAEATWRHRVGVRPLDPADWLELGAHRERDLALKRRILDRAFDQVFVALPDAEPECEEVLEAVVEHLRRRDPALVADEAPVGHARARGGHPLVRAALLVQEDLLLLVERGGRLVLGAGCVCFPNRWDLPSKLGQSMAEIHEPVGRYAEDLHGPTEAFLARLRPERPYWRLAWSLVDLPELYQPGAGWQRPADDPVTAERAGDTTYLRVERETLRRFPRHGCVLFTIRSYVRPLSFLRDHPEAAGRLAGILRTMPPEVAAYKGLDRIGPAVAGWLERTVTSGR